MFKKYLTGLILFLSSFSLFAIAGAEGNPHAGTNLQTGSGSHVSKMVNRRLSKLVRQVRKTAKEELKIRRDRNKKGEKETTTSTQSTTPADAVCMQTAVDAREAAILSALTTKHTALEAALTARKDALHAAWGMTDTSARKEAIKTGWETFRSSTSTSIKTFRDAKKSAWDAFKQEVKNTCKSTAPLEENGEGEEGL